MDPGSVKIALGRTCRDWWACRRTLAVGGEPQQWQLAFGDYFRGRLADRYLDPIELLQTHGSRLGEGFSIVAIQCSLIEFLESSLQGTSYHHLLKGEKLGAYEYSSSQDIFVSFLSKREPFASAFDEPLAKDFYVSVRCGLLHEARTKGGWLIHAGNSSPAMVDRTQRILYRDKFQRALLDLIGWYEGAIQTDRLLQEAFLRKFDSLCS